MNALILMLFLGGLAACVASGTTVLAALLFGLFCFAGQALLQGHGLCALGRMIWSGVRTIGNILCLFALIGLLTGVWRAAGTIPCIIHLSLPLVDPSLFLLWAFLLCAGMSLLLGTSFGTVSTLGVICMLLARTAGLDDGPVAGAILSGIYVGDRSSPLSSSAALVCSLTGTALYDNIRIMWRTAALPLGLTCLAYVFLSSSSGDMPVSVSVTSALEEHFVLSGWALLPAICVVVLSLLRVNVKVVMMASILLGILVCLLVQRLPVEDVLRSLVWGYAPRPGIEMLAGGGLLSMASVGGIVLLASSYAGILEATGLLGGLRRAHTWLAGHIGRIRATVLTSIPLSAISCNQTLAIILVHQLCAPAHAQRSEMAMVLENSAVLVSVLIPWSIAGSVPCAALGVDASCLPYAFFLYLVPLLTCLRRPAC